MPGRGPPPSPCGGGEPGVEGLGEVPPGGLLPLPFGGELGPDLGEFTEVEPVAAEVWALVDHDLPLRPEEVARRRPWDTAASRRGPRRASCRARSTAGPPPPAPGIRPPLSARSDQTDPSAPPDAGVDGLLPGRHLRQPVPHTRHSILRTFPDGQAYLSVVPPTSQPRRARSPAVIAAVAPQISCPPTAKTGTS